MRATVAVRPLDMQKRLCKAALPGVAKALFHEEAEVVDRERTAGSNDVDEPAARRAGRLVHALSVRRPPQTEALRAGQAPAPRSTGSRSTPPTSAAPARTTARAGSATSPCQFLTYNAMLDFDVVDALEPGRLRRLRRRSSATRRRRSSGRRPTSSRSSRAGALPGHARRRALGDDPRRAGGPASTSTNPGLILVDTHLDTAPDVGGELLSHCCPITRAVDAGFDPTKIALVGISGWMNPRTELAYCREHGITRDLARGDLGARRPPGRSSAGARGGRRGTDGVYLSFDIDCARRRPRPRDLLPDARRADQPGGDRARARRRAPAGWSASTWSRSRRASTRRPGPPCSAAGSRSRR